MNEVVFKHTNIKIINNYEHGKKCHHIQNRS